MFKFSNFQKLKKKNAETLRGRPRQNGTKLNFRKKEKDDAIAI